MKVFLAALLLLIINKAVAQKADSSSTQTDSLPQKSLQAVTVRSVKKAIEIQPDKVIVNVDAQPAAVGENVLDILRRSPGVALDASENIQLNGKGGTMVLIDGKNTQLSPGDLVQLLKSIEASNIKQIELIANPSAKYDAAGAAGIINIKLKKSLTNGMNGTASGSYVQSKHARQNLSTNLNWRKEKAALFFNGGFNNGNQDVTANNDRMAGSRTFTQRSIEKDEFEGSSVRVGADYYVNKNNTVGGLIMFNSRTSNMDNSSTTVARGLNMADTTFSTRSLIPFRTKRRAFNLNYNAMGNTFEYAMDADYTLHQSSVRNLITNDFLNSSGVKFGNNANLNDQNVDIHLYAIKGDLAKTLTPSLKLETGYKAMITRTDNMLDIQNNDGAGWTIDTGKTNSFNYQEAIIAGYLSLKGTNKNLSWQVGLRGERTDINGQSIDLKGSKINKPDTAYLNLFPTLFLQYKLSENHQFGLNANRRIDRPNYQDQNPFIYFLDALNTEQGNPYLKPQFTNSVEVSYTYKYATSFKIAYARTEDYIEWLTYQNDKYTVQLPQNAGTKQMVSFSFSSPLKVTKWWSGYFSLTPYYHYYKIALSGFGNIEVQEGGSWAFNSYIGNNFELGKGWKANLGGWFNFQNRATIYVSKPLGSLDIGVQKNLLQDKATFKLAVVDIFNTQRWEQRATTSELQLHTFRKWESQNITLGLSVRFGNSKIKSARDRQAGNEDAVNRIK